MKASKSGFEGFKVGGRIIAKESVGTGGSGRKRKTDKGNVVPL